jgi:uncharacterized protein YggL (DUF469 family)
MKAQLITDVKGIRIELSIKEATEAVEKPKKLQDYIASMLQGAGCDVDAGTEDSWFRCICGKKCKTLRGLGVHKKACDIWKEHKKTKKSIRVGSDAEDKIGTAALDAYIEEEEA